MYAKRPTNGKHNFRIKLLSGNNVVMVEAEGYETEIFVPELLQGRITFQNIVPNRRCCYQAQLQSSKQRNSRYVPGMPSSESTLLERKPLGSPTNINKFWRMTAGQDIQKPRSPMAFSTPNHSSFIDTNKENAVRRRSIEPTSQSSNQMSQLSQQSNLTPPTPQQARREPVPQMPSPFKVVNDTLMQIPPGIKVIRLYRNDSPGIPKRICRVVSGSRSEQRRKKRATSSPHSSKSPQRIVEMSKINLPTTPCSEKSMHVSRRNTVTFPRTESKWRKCMTPIRTYVRQSTSKQRHSAGSSAKKVRKVLPTCISNPSQGRKGTHQLDVQKRKLIIDAQKCITPQSFRRRQITNIDIEKRNKSTSQLPTTRSEYERSKSTAFDLITNSNRSHCLSPKLSEQFTKCCVNKASSTYPKYKLLCSVPPLESEESTQTRRQHVSNVTAAAMAEREAAQAYTTNAVQRSINSKNS